MQGQAAWGRGAAGGKAVERGQAGGRRRARRTGKQAEMGGDGTALGGIFGAPGPWLWGCAAFGKMALYWAKWLQIGEKWLCIGAKRICIGQTGSILEKNGSVLGKNGSISGQNGSAVGKMALYWAKWL